MTDAAARVRARCRRDGDCLVWTGATNADGYGVIRVPGGFDYVHRVIYVDEVGPIPEGYVIDHVKTRGCRSRACCKSAHLEAVTQAENLRRGEGTKLTPDDVAAIRAAGGTHAALGRRFGVDPWTIAQIRKNDLWKEAA